MADRTATASAFADWVFEKTVRRRSTSPSKEELHVADQRKRLGELSHRTLDLAFQQRWLVDRIGKLNGSEYQLVYSDNSSFVRTRTYFASSLTVGGAKLACRPDVVFRHIESGRIVIVERKTTLLHEAWFPASGWPNAEAQLWCYSKVDDWISAPQIELVLQVWQHSGEHGLRLANEGQIWTAGEQEHESRCARWFAEYQSVFGK